MKHASLKDLDVVYRHFQNNRNVFPHLRKDKLERNIRAGECIYQDGVVLTYRRNKVSAPVIAASAYKAPAGAVVIHQFLNSQRFNGAGGRVFREFAEEMMPCDILLSVRADNKVACDFYKRHGMVVIGRGTWASGSILGLIYWLRV